MNFPILFAQSLKAPKTTTVGAQKTTLTVIDNAYNLLEMNNNETFGAIKKFKQRFDLLLNTKNLYSTENVNLNDLKSIISLWLKITCCKII